MQLPKDAKEFIQALYPEGVLINIRSKSDKAIKSIVKNPILRKEEWLSEHSSIEEIYKDNRTSNFNTLICVNASNRMPVGKGFSGKDISYITAQFFEIDPDIPKGLSMDEELAIIAAEKEKQWSLIFSAPIKPTIIVETRKSYHVYYKLKPAEKQSSGHMVQLFTDIQKGLIRYFKSDSSTQSLAFPMRLPGFSHNKKDPFPVKIVHFEPENVYTQYDIIRAFGIRTSIIQRKPVKYNQDIKVIKNANMGDVEELLNKCEFINTYYHTPVDMGYNIWFGIGTNLIRLGIPGEESWADMSRRDAENFDEDNFTKKLEDIKKYSYCYGCEKLGCDKYLKAIENGMPAPCGVHSPVALLDKVNNKSRRIPNIHIQERVEISQEEARILIQLEYNKILLENTPGIYYIKVPCGIGKTMGLVEVLKSHLSATQKKVLWLGDTHNQIKEASKQFEDFKTLHLKSRDYFESLKGVCPYIKVIEDYHLNKGLNGRYTHCLSSRCPLSEEVVTDEYMNEGKKLKSFKIYKIKTSSGAKKCEYMQQYRQIQTSDIVFGAHNRINMANSIKPDILVIDENFLKEYMHRVEFSTDDVEYSIRLLEECCEKVSDNDIEIFHVFTALLKNLNLFLVPESIEKFITSEMVDTLSTLNERFMLLLTRKAEIKGRDLRVKNSVYDGCRFILDYLMYMVHPLLTSDKTSKVLHVQSLRFRRDEKVYSFTRRAKLPEGCITLILDATTPKELYEGALGKPIHTFDISEQYHIKQESRLSLVNMGKYTKSQLCNGDNKDYTIIRAFEFIDRLVRDTGYASVGLITFNDVYKTLDGYGITVEDIVKSARVEHEHFNNLRGKNQFRECDAVFVLGFMQHPSQEIAKSAVTLLDMDVPLEKLMEEVTEDMKSSYIGVPLPLADATRAQTLEIQKVDFRCKEAGYIYEAYCIGELVQAIGRARIYDKRDKLQDVYVMTNMESSGMFRYDEIIDDHGWDRNHGKRAKTVNANIKKNFDLLIGKAVERGLIKDGCKLPPSLALLNLAIEEEIKISKNKLYELYNTYKKDIQISNE